MVIQRFRLGRAAASPSGGEAETVLASDLNVEREVPMGQARGIESWWAHS